MPSAAARSHETEAARTQRFDGLVSGLEASLFSCHFLLIGICSGHWQKTPISFSIWKVFTGFLFPKNRIPFFIRPSFHRLSWTPGRDSRPASLLKASGRTLRPAALICSSCGQPPGCFWWPSASPLPHLAGTQSEALSGTSPSTAAGGSSERMRPCVCMTPGVRLKGDLYESRRPVWEPDA